MVSTSGGLDVTVAAPSKPSKVLIASKASSPALPSDTPSVESAAAKPRLPSKIAPSLRSSRSLPSPALPTPTVLVPSLKASSRAAKRPRVESGKYTGFTFSSLLTDIFALLDVGSVYTVSDNSDSGAKMADSPTIKVEAPPPKPRKSSAKPAATKPSRTTAATSKTAVPKGASSEAQTPAIPPPSLVAPTQVATIPSSDRPDWLLSFLPSVIGYGVAPQERIRSFFLPLLSGN